MFPVDWLFTGNKRFLILDFNYYDYCFIKYSQLANYSILLGIKF